MSTVSSDAVRLQASFSDGDDFAVTLTIEDGDDTVVMTVTVTPSTVPGQITYNGSGRRHRSTV